MDVLNNRASTKAKIQKYDTMREQIQVRRSELTKRILEEQTSGNKQQKEKEKYAAELEDISAQIIELNEKQNTYEEQIKSIQAEMNRLSEQFRISQTSYHREQSRLESLKNITERYDGYGNSIRRVMDNKNQEYCYS